MLSLILAFCAFGGFELSFFFVFVVITIVVCMGGYGISLLVSFSRSSGEDFYRVSFLI